MKSNQKLIHSTLFLLSCLFVQAQNTEEKIQSEKTSFFNKNVDYQIKGQLSIGGASPMGIPAQIRKIESFKPAQFLGAEVNATKWFNDKQKFGIRIGAKFEGRGMKTQAQVKNYYTQIEDDSGAQTKGYFTGHVLTKMRNSYITMPVSFVWNATNRWNFYGGFYLSWITHRSFTGHIYDGTFREGTPIGEPTVFEGTAKGIYDFSDDLRTFQWGNQLGAEYKLNQHVSFSFDVSMANSQIFKKDFESISFRMYNIFGNIGIGYTF